MMEINNGENISAISTESREYRMAFDQHGNFLFPHEATANGSLAEVLPPAIPNFTLPAGDMSRYTLWSHNTDDDPYQLMQCTKNNNTKSRDVTDRDECDVDLDLHGLVENILEEADSPDNSYYTAEGNPYAFNSVWSPKMSREDLQQNKTQASAAAFLPNHAHREFFNEPQGQQMAKNVEELCQQFNGIDTAQQWLCPSSNGDMDSCTPRPKKLPPGLPIPNSYLSQTRESKHNYTSADEDGGNREPMNNFPGRNYVFAPQSKMSGRRFDPYYEDHPIQSGAKPMSNEQYAPQVNKFFNDFPVLMAGEQDSSHPRESENTSRQMHYEDSMAEQWKFASPAAATHSTPAMQIKKEPVGERGAAQAFQAYNSSQDLPGFNPEKTEYFQQPMPFSASFKSPNQYQKSPNQYQNNMAMYMGNTSLPVTRNQYLQRLSQQSQMRERVNGGPPNPSSFLSPSLSEFAPQQSHQMQRRPQFLRGYGHRDGPSINRQPGQGQAGTGLASGRKRDENSEMQLDKNRMHAANFLGGLSAEGDRNPNSDVLGRMHSPQRFGRGRVLMMKMKEPFIDRSSHPGKRSSQMPFNSPNFSSRSSLPYRSDAPVMDLGDKVPDNALNRDLTRSGGKSIHPGTPSASTSPGVTKNRSGPMTLLHIYLEECYEQWRHLEQERKKTEVIMTKLFPLKSTAPVTSTILPKMPPNPTRVDHLIVNQFREYTKVASLLEKMANLFSADISLSLDKHYMAICVTQARRKEESANMLSNRQRPGGSLSRNDRDTELLAISLKDLSSATKKSCTTLWCALLLISPKPVKPLDQHVDVDAPRGRSSPEESYNFGLAMF